MPRLPKLTATFITVLASALAAAFTGAAAQETMPVPRPPHPVIQRDLTLTDMRVEIQIRGATAHTTIRQTLRNDGSWVAEGQYMLPLPAGATVSDFALIDGDQRLTPKVLPADEARTIYQDIVRKMRDPGLLEYQNNSTFSVSVFPFQPGASRSVEVSFNQTLGGTTELVSYGLPLRWAGWSRCADTNFVISYSIESDYDLGTISSPNFSVSVNRDGNRRASGSYEAKVNDFSNDFNLNIGRRTGDFAASLMCFPGESGEDGYFLLSLLAAMPSDAKYVPKDVLLIFDKSGSMSGDKIEQAKGALRFVLGQLKTEDRFGLVYYSDAVTKAFDGLRAASADNTAEARRIVDSLTADGGTDIYSALDTGAQMLKPDGRPTYVIFMTDGLPTVGNTNVDDIVNNAKGRFSPAVKLFVFGVGYDLNTTLLDTLSYNHHGSASYVTEGEDIEVKVSQFYAKMASPALINLNVNFSGLDAYDIMPKQLPDLFHNNEIFLAGRFRGRPAGTVGISVNGSTDSGPRALNASIAPNVSSSNHQIPRLWAARKVSFLLDEIRLHGDNKELLTEIDRLAIRFGIVTPYTSYLITEPGMYFEPAAERMADLEENIMLSRDDASGEGAVGRSKMNQQNQAADVAAAPQSAGAAAGGGFVAGADFDLGYDYQNADARRRQGSADPYASVNYVNNQTFVQQNLPSDATRFQWVDARFDRTAQQAVRVTAYGDTYFQLLDEFPALADYLSQGEEVVLVVAPDLVLETTTDEVTNTSTEMEQLRSALKRGDYLSLAPERGGSEHNLLPVLGSVGGSNNHPPSLAARVANAIAAASAFMAVVCLVVLVAWRQAKARLRREHLHSWRSHVSAG